MHTILSSQELADGVLRFLGKVAVGCVVLVAVVAVPIFLFRLVGRIGWVSHSHDTRVLIHGDWLVGEFRNCQMLESLGTVSYSDDHKKLPNLRVSSPFGSNRLGR
jgi:hypothetical protein